MEDKKTFDSPEVKLHFLDYWRIIRIRKTVILAVFLLVTITATLVTYILPQSYASTVRISVEKDGSDTYGISDRATGGGGFDPFWVQTQFEKIQSKPVLYTVITNLQLRKLWAKRLKEENELPLELAYALLKRDTEISQSRNTSLIEIKVFSEDRFEAPKIANEIANVYRESRLRRWKENNSQGLLSLRADWTNQDNAVHELQEKVEGLRSTLKISADGDAVISQTTVEQEKVRKLESTLIEVDQEFRAIDVMYRAVTNMTHTEFKHSATGLIPDPQLNTLFDQLNSAEQKYAEMKETYAEAHPEVLRLKRVLEQIREQVEARLDGILLSIKVKRDAQLARLDSLTTAVDSYRAEEIGIAKARRPFMQAKRDLEGAQNIRDKLYSRIVQEEVELNLPRSNIVEIVDQAEASSNPVRPRKTLNITLGVIVGLVIGVGLAFFIEYLDTSVKTIDDVERALQAPVLGVIPQNVGHLIFEGHDSPHAEAYRVLRTNILFSLKDPKLNTITVVSAGAGEGKSTTIFNLATIFAQNGSRVLIVDSDLRRPSLHKILKVSNTVGLTNYLLKQNSIEEVIQTSPLATLDFLPSGKLPSSSMGVLSSTQMKELIRELRRRYDYVFFDSPPIMGVSDASILASEVDCVMQVIQYRRYPQPMTIRAKQMIQKVGGNLLGIVLNNINMASDENYYYYSGYYYDYYSKNEESMEKPKAVDAAASEDKVEIKPKY